MKIMIRKRKKIHEKIMIMTMKTVKENSHETMSEYRQAINQTAPKQKQYLSSNRDISK